jgi:hypothetical protein
MKRYTVVTFGVAVVTTICIIGCSVVFSASLSGVVADKDDYEKASVDPGINDVSIYLYLEQSDRDADYNAWDKDKDGTLPETRDEERYHLHTTTSLEPQSGTNGYFSFDNIIWENLLPTYGNSGDVKEFYLNFYHSAYGMVRKNKTVASDADETMGPVLLSLPEGADRYIRYGGQLNGLVFVDVNKNSVYDPDPSVHPPNTDYAVTGAEIKLYVNRGSGLSSGDLSDVDYATYSITESGSNGVFSFQQVVWQDTINPQRYSAVTCYIIVEEITLPTPVGAVTGKIEFTMYANTVNFVYVPLQTP